MTARTPAGTPPPAARITILDILRALALLGIVIVHTHDHFNLYLPMPPAEGWQAAANSAADWAYEHLFVSKSFLLFSFLFGLSFFIQLDRREQQGIDFRKRFMWRLTLLFLLGLATLGAVTAVIGAALLILGLPLLLAKKHPWIILGWLAAALSLLVFNPHTSVAPWALMGGLKYLYYYLTMPGLHYSTILFAAGIGIGRGLLVLALMAALAVLGLAKFAAAETLFSMLVCIALSLIFNAITLPVLLKFGAEKSRIISIVIFVAVFGGVMLLGQLADSAGVELALEPWLVNALPVVLAMVCAGALVISYFVALGIYQRKEF